MKRQFVKTKRANIIQITTQDERFYLRTTDKKYVPSVTWIADHYPKGVGFYKWLAEHGWDEAEGLKSAAGERGSKVHQALEVLLGGATVAHDATFVNPTTGNQEELSVEEYEAVLSFVAWFEEAKPEILALETTVFNDEYNYAGTLDLKCLIAGEVWIIDFKTSQQVWPSHILQLSALAHCPENALDNKQKLPKLAVLQVGYRKNKARWKFTETPDQFPLFLAARQIWANENADVSPKQYELPISTKLTINEPKGK